MFCSERASVVASAPVPRGLPRTDRIRKLLVVTHPPKTLSTWAALFRSVPVKKYSMSALGHKRTFAVQNGMSALPPKADMCNAKRNVRFVPIADVRWVSVFYPLALPLWHARAKTLADKTPVLPSSQARATLRPCRLSKAGVMSEPLISRGFRGRRGSGATSARLPPGQHLVTDFPVLSAGPTPVPDLATWRFTLEGGASPLALWSWAEFNALPQSEIAADIHCVTTWSKFDTQWRGVSVDTLLEAAGLSEPPGAFVLAHCDGGYTTNVPSEDLVDGKAMIAITFDGEPLDPEHGGPARLLLLH